MNHSRRNHGNVFVVVRTVDVHGSLQAVGGYLKVLMGKGKIVEHLTKNDLFLRDLSYAVNFCPSKPSYRQSKISDIWNACKRRGGMKIFSLEWRVVFLWYLERIGPRILESTLLLYDLQLWMEIRWNVATIIHAINAIVDTASVEIQKTDIPLSRVNKVKSHSNRKYAWYFMVSKSPVIGDWV